MSGVFIYSEDLGLARQLVTLTASRNMPACAVAHAEPQAAALARCPVQAVYLLKGASARPEDYARALAQLVSDQAADLLLVADTISGREVAAAAAAYLDAGLVSGASEISSVGDELLARHMMYGGAVVRQVRLGAPVVVTVLPGMHQAAAEAPDAAPIITLDVETDTRISTIEKTAIVRGEASLASARAVVGVGLGFDKKADLGLADDLAAALHGAIGCTRPVADDKRWLPSEQYIGISGLNIRPDLYVAVGISGQVQHTVGLRDAKIIVAINKSESAPIFAAADYGIVGDLYKVLPLLTAAIKSR